MVLLKNYRTMSENGTQGNLTPLPPLCRKKRQGFSLVELMIAMLVGMIVLGSLYNLFTVQSKILGNQEMAVEMQQNARMAMDIMTREIRLAGFNPKVTLSKCAGTLPSSLTSTPCVGIQDASTNSISFTSDINGNGDLTPGIPSIPNPNENITYDRYESPSGSGIYALGRTSNGSKQPVVENIDSLTFTYLNNADGTAATIDAIRSIQVSIVAKTAKPDPSYPTNGGYRTYTLTSRITPRNLAY